MKHPIFNTSLLTCLVLAGPLMADGAAQEPARKQKVPIEDVEAVVFGPRPLREDQWRWLRERREAIVPLLKKWTLSPRGGGRWAVMYGGVCLEVLGGIGSVEGPLVSDDDVPFLESLFYDDDEKSHRSVFSVARTLAAIDTPLSIAAIKRAFDATTDGGRKQQLLLALEHSSCAEAVAWLREILQSNKDPRVRYGAFRSLTQILHREGRHDERDEVLLLEMADAEEQAVCNGVMHAAQFGATACLPAIEALPTQRDGLGERTLYDIERASAFLRALRSEDANSAMLALLWSDPDRYAFFVTRHLRPEEGIVDRLRQFRLEIREGKLLLPKPRRSSFSMADILLAIQRLGGTLTEEEQRDLRGSLPVR